MQMDRSLSITEIADQTSLSQSPCSRRVMLPGVQEIQSSVLLDELKYTTQLPL